MHGVSTRSVDELAKALGLEGISKSQVSRLCAEIDERVQAFLTRPIEGEWPYLWLDATSVKARRGHHIVSVAEIVAVGVNTDGRTAVLGMALGHSEAGPDENTGEPHTPRKFLLFMLAQNDSVHVPFGEVVLPVDESSVAGYVALHGSVVMIEDACRGIGVPLGNGRTTMDEAREKLAQLGVRLD